MIKLILIFVTLASNVWAKSPTESIETLRRETGTKKEYVIVNFWASWCTPCIKEFKSLKAISERYKDKLEVISISADEKDQKKKIEQFKKKYNLDFHFLADEDERWNKEYKVNTIPRTFIYKNNKLIYDANEEIDFMSEEILSKIK